MPRLQSTARKPAPFAGWTSRGFVLRTTDGGYMRLSGPRASVIAELQRFMPAWHRLATGTTSDASRELAEMIQREAATLGIDLTGDASLPSFSNA